MLLHFEKENFRNIVVTAAKYFNIQEYQIEKDYFV